MNDAKFKFSFRLLRWFCPPHLLEEIEGDLLQKFERDVKLHGERKSKRKMLWNTIRFFRPGIILRNRYTMTSPSMQLIQNNFLMALRIVRKDRVFSIVNIFGLTVGIAASILIFQYVFFELNYDRFHPNVEKTFRVFASTYQDGELKSQSALTPAYIAPTLKEKLSGIDQVSRLISTRWWFDCTLAYANGYEYRIFNESELYYADPAILSVFGYSLLMGDAQTALIQPYSIVLSTKVAEKYFGNEEPMGKTLHLKGSGEDHDYIVTGVMADPAPNSHLSPTILASISSLESQTRFNTTDSYTYIQLTTPMEVATLKSSLDKLVEELAPPANGYRIELDLEPITDIHLHSFLQYDMKATGDIKSVYFLLTVAIIILIMAWINYANLTAARSFKRSKEVGIRKVSGASRAQIVFQFLTETFVFNLIGIFCASALAYLMAPKFYQLVGVSIPTSYLMLGESSIVVYFILALFVFGVFFSGFFPSVALSAFNPIWFLKGKFIRSSSGFSLRKITLVFQFACAIALTTTVLIFNQQFKFMRTQDLQIAISKTLIVKAPVNIDSTYRQNLASFKNTLKGLAIIKTISTSGSVPGSTIGWTGTIKKENEKSSRDFTINVIDPDFVEAYQLKLLAGRNFETFDFPLKHFGDKPEPVMVNREGLNQLGYTKAEDIIGTTIFWDKNKCYVVGVIDNFHQESLKKSIQPILFTANMGPTISLKLADDNKNLAESIEQTRTIWNTHFPNNAFDFSLLDDQFDQQYETDEQVARLFNFFCALSLIISALGLFGLSLFSFQQRTREISIRKVLGASVVNLLRLLSQEYFILILVASIVALPLSHWGTREWLSSFAYHITPGASIYIIPIILISLIALLTVGTQTIKTAFRNPTESLKHE